MRRASFFVSAAAFSAACATDPDPAGANAADSDAPSATAPTWHAEVKPLLQQKCLACHGADAALSGLSFAEYEQARDWRVAIGAAVAAGTMPPWLADGDCADYANDFSLTDDEKATLAAWVAADAPEGDPATAAPDAEPFALPTLDRIDATLEMPSAYTPPADQVDDYRCFILDWPYDDDAWVTGYDVAPGNLDVVHHLIPYIISPADAETFRQLDADDPGEGYDCFGGPGGDVQTLIETRWLGSWAPGVGATRLPEGHGIRVPAGSLIVAQLHYNLGASGPAADQSAIHLQVETERQKGASIQPWTEVSWVLGAGMDIPANTDDVTHEMAYEITAGDGTFTMHGAGLHMHTLGRSGRLTVEHTDGSESCLLDIPNYDFNWQRGYQLQEPVTVTQGDVVRLTCAWDNPTDQDVAWGDGTGDEMCLGTTLLTWE